MRIAVVHAWDVAGDVAPRILESLRRIWPVADVFTSECGAEYPPQRLTAFAPGAHHHLEHTSGVAAPPRTESIGGGYDLVFSTSPVAAGRIELPGGTRHACYLPPLPSATGSASALLDEQPERMHSLWSYEQGTLRLEIVPGTERMPRETLHAQASVPPRGVTHCIAASRTVRERYRNELGISGPVIYPPIKTSVFRPGFEPRRGNYLLVCRGESLPDIGLAVEACRAVGRKLIIVGWNGPRAANLPPHPHVEFVDAPSEIELRDHYRRCRGLLAPTLADFDSAIVEAQACGAPVIAFHCDGTREVLLDAESTGQGTGLFFYEPTVSSLVSAIREFERRPQKFSPDLGMAQAARFSEAHFEQDIHLLASHLLAQTEAPAATLPLAKPDGRPRDGEQGRGKAAA
jgi:hypothetical protein